MPPVVEKSEKTEWEELLKKDLMCRQYGDKELARALELHDKFCEGEIETFNKVDGAAGESITKHHCDDCGFWGSEWEEEK